MKSDKLGVVFERSAMIKTAPFRRERVLVRAVINPNLIAELEVKGEWPDMRVLLEQTLDRRLDEEVQKRRYMGAW